MAGGGCGKAERFAPSEGRVAYSGCPAAKGTALHGVRVAHSNGLSCIALAA